MTRRAEAVDDGELVGNVEDDVGREACAEWGGRLSVESHARHGYAGWMRGAMAVGEPDFYLFEAGWRPRAVGGAERAKTNAKSGSESEFRRRPVRVLSRVTPRSHRPPNRASRHSPISISPPRPLGVSSGHPPRLTLAVTLAVASPRRSLSLLLLLPSMPRSQSCSPTAAPLSARSPCPPYSRSPPLPVQPLANSSRRLRFRTSSMCLLLSSTFHSDSFSQLSLSPPLSSANALLVHTISRFTSARPLLDAHPPRTQLRAHRNPHGRTRLGLSRLSRCLSHPLHSGSLSTFHPSGSLLAAHSVPSLAAAISSTYTRIAPS